MQHVTQTQFCERIPTLLINARDLPRRPVDFAIVLISALSGLDTSRTYSEKQLDGELQRWILLAGEFLPLDHTTLRRYLVDAGFLGRDPAGTAYSVNASGRQVSFDPEILAVDLQALLAAAKQERAERKRRHQSRVQDA